MVLRLSIPIDTRGLDHEILANFATKNFADSPENSARVPLGPSIRIAHSRDRGPGRPETLCSANNTPGAG